MNLFLFPDQIDSGALLSPCRSYRYLLWRRWADGPYLNFIMLNPSTADESEDDATIRRCVERAKRMEFSALSVTNLFAYRSTDPRMLKTVADPVGPDNDKALVDTATGAGMVICAWGNHGEKRAAAVLKILSGVRVHCLRKTKIGQPEHPLYIPYDVVPQLINA